MILNHIRINIIIEVFKNDKLSNVNCTILAENPLNLNEIQLNYFFTKYFYKIYKYLIPKFTKYLVRVLFQKK